MWSGYATIQQALYAMTAYFLDNNNGYVSNLFNLWKEASRLSYILLYV